MILVLLVPFTDEYGANTVRFGVEVARGAAALRTVNGPCHLGEQNPREPLRPVLIRPLILVI